MLTACADELPNPHANCIRETLAALICHENDVRRINVELRDLQRTFDEDVRKFEKLCDDNQMPDCSNTESLLGVTKRIATIREVNECFNNKVNTLRKNRDEIINAARQCLQELSVEKCKLKSFHEKTVDHLKRRAIRADDPIVIRNCEKDICEMHKLFVKEVAFIKKCERELQPFVQLCHLEDQFASCCFEGYEWLPKGKSLQVINDLAFEIKELMGPAIIKALAQMHVMQPQEPKSYLSAYLMNLDRNEKMLEEKLNLLAHAT